MNLAERQTEPETGTAVKLAEVLGVLFAVATVVPQAQYYGRGAKMTFELFAFWCCAAYLSGGLGAVVARQKVPLALALAFMGALVVTYRWRSDDPAVTLQSVIRLLLLLMVFVVASYHAQCSPVRWSRMREWMVFLIAAAILPSLWLLYENPKIARYLGAAGDWADNSSVDLAVAGRGVGTYGLYNLLAVVIPCWLSLAVTARGLRQLLLLAAVGVASLAVALSTFTAATVLLIAGLGLALVGLPLLKRSRYSLLVLVFSCGALAALIVAGNFLIRESKSFEFGADKAIRLFEGMMDSGLVAGDETGRGEMFMRTMDTFLSNPVFGVGYDRSVQLVGGHSSWVDPWALYGLVGYLPFFLFQALLTHRIIRNWMGQPSNIAAFGSLVCWGLFWAAGFLNPTIFWVLPGVLLFSDINLDKPRASHSRVARG